MTSLPEPFAIVPPARYFPPLGDLAPIPKLDPIAIPPKVYAEPIDITPAILWAPTIDRLVRDVQRRLMAEYERMRRLIPPAPPGYEWKPEISHDVEYDVDAFTAHDTIRLRFRFVNVCPHDAIDYYADGWQCSTCGIGERSPFAR